MAEEEQPFAPPIVTVLVKKGELDVRTEKDGKTFTERKPLVEVWTTNGPVPDTLREPARDREGKPVAGTVGSQIVRIEDIFVDDLGAVEVFGRPVEGSDLAKIKKCVRYELPASAVLVATTLHDDEEYEIMLEDARAARDEVEPEPDPEPETHPNGASGTEASPS